MQLKLDLLGQGRLYDEIVEPPTDECVGLYVGVGHVVLGTDFVLLGGDLFCCAWVRGVLLWAREIESRERKRRNFSDIQRYIYNISINWRFKIGAACQGLRKGSFGLRCLVVDGSRSLWFSSIRSHFG